MPVEEQLKISTINVAVISDGLVVDSAVFAADDLKTAQDFVKHGVWNYDKFKVDDVEILPEYFGIGDRFNRTDNPRLMQSAGWYKRISMFPFELEKYNPKTGQSDLSEYEERHKEIFLQMQEYYQQQYEALDLPGQPPSELPAIETWIPFDEFMAIIKEAEEQRLKQAEAVRLEEEAKT